MPLWAESNISIEDKVNLSQDGGISLEVDLVKALSADGKIAVGSRVGAANDVIWSGENWQTEEMIKPTISPASATVISPFTEMRAISADGRIFAGGSTDIDSGVNIGSSQAAIWQPETPDTLRDLGTLSTDNLGISIINALSADGKVAGGSSEDWDNGDLGDMKAVIWTGDNWQEKKALDGDEIFGLNADGSIAVGTDWNAGWESATVWFGNNWQEKKYLGSLKADNSGFSKARTISSNGKVIGGEAVNDMDRNRATLWFGDNWQEKKDLGTLKADNSGSSGVYALSADGKIAAGDAESDLYRVRATLWFGDNWQEKADLGTLKTDNSGLSRAYSINADGTVIGGTSEADDGKFRPIIWKVRYLTEQPTQPATPIVVASVDVENTRAVLRRLGQDTLSLVQTQRFALNRLHQHCQPTVENSFCYQADWEWSGQSDVKEQAAGLSLGWAATKNIAISAKIDRTLSRHLPSHYRKQKSNHGLSLAMQFNLPLNYGTWYLRPSLAWNSYDVLAVRPIQSHTEEGIGKSKLSGKSYRLQAGFNADNWGAYLGIERNRLFRAGFMEQNVAFPIYFADLNEKQTALLAGVNASLPLSEQWKLLGAVDIKRVLNGNSAHYRAKGDYIGEFDYAMPQKAHQAWVSIGIAHQITPAFGWSLTPYHAIGGNKHYGIRLSLKGEF